MSNPFPGMNPYLEDEDWQNFHNQLAVAIVQKIIPLIRPRYKAVVEKYVVKSDAASMGISLTYQPDLAIFKNKVSEPELAYGKQIEITQSDLSLPFNVPLEVKIPVIEIRDRQKNRLITVIEILSPANKTGKGFVQYQKKRLNLLNSKIHLLKIDLLRRGKRIMKHPQIEDCDYLIALTRSGQPLTDFWTIDLTEKLPVIPIPLTDDDKDVPLDLQAIVNNLHETSFFNDNFDYAKMPPLPKFSKEKRQWIQTLISKKVNAK